MKLFSGILGLTLSSVVALATANAADLSAGPAGDKDGPVYAWPGWAGFYIGINGGYGWSARSTDNTIVDVWHTAPQVVTNVPVKAPIHGAVLGEARSVTIGRRTTL